MNNRRLGPALVALSILAAGCTSATAAQGPGEQGSEAPPSGASVVVEVEEGEGSSARVARARGAAGPVARARAAGVRLDGLQRTPNCPDWTLRDGTCTHGPDPAPAGVDVGTPATLAQLASRTLTLATSTGGVPCYGDGVTGPRVQALYVRASDVADRFDAVRTSLSSYAAAVDKVFVDSAAKTGGLRHVRWVTTPTCELDLLPIVVTAAGDDSLSSMVKELKAQGHGRTDRKYLIWADATRYCGVAQTRYDDRASSDNPSNNGVSYARVDSKCWGLTNSVEAHELTHMLGGVQMSAPNSNGSGHCTDESDRMCYAETGALPIRKVCDKAHERLLDCRNDDYFSTAPKAGSYLATHWNTANNVYLSSQVPEA